MSSISILLSDLANLNIVSVNEPKPPDCNCSLVTNIPPVNTMASLSASYRELKRNICKVKKIWSMPFICATVYLTIIREDMHEPHFFSYAKRVKIFTTNTKLHRKSSFLFFLCLLVKIVTSNFKTDFMQCEGT